MAQADSPQTPEGSAAAALEGGTYEIIRQRLLAQAGQLRGRLQQLNAARKEVFGSIDMALLGTERITTAHNCVPRDMVAFGQVFLFGYNVHLGLKTETELADVFSVYRFAEGTFHELSLDLLGNEQFGREFREIYRYYKTSQFARFFSQGPYLYLVFQVGKTAADIKALKWLRRDDRLEYVDNRSDHEVRNPPQHDFEWIRTTRDAHQAGRFPHISIRDRLFVETVGGDLTIKIENNTDSGEGIYREDVDNADQTLDDAEIYYAIVGHIILLKIRPYQERDFRHIVYNEKTRTARRIDSIAHACVLLPDDQGLIFANGYYLQNGQYKTFESDQQGMQFERRIVAPNGEDYLYVFTNREQGSYVLLRYNVIEQRVDTPLVCHGFTLFEGGELTCFKRHEEPQKHHAIQIWRTPYVGESYVPVQQSDSLLYKIGNRDIVRGMAECHELLALIDKEDTYADLYVDLVKLSQDIIDSYFWLDKPETFQLKEVLQQIKEAAASAVNEFEKVVRVKQNTASQMARIEQETASNLAAIHRQRFEQILEFVAALGRLRQSRGEIVALRDLRYADTARIEHLEQQVVQQSDQLARRCVAFLLRDDALAPYARRVADQQQAVEGLKKVTDARALEEQVQQSAGELEMLIDVVGNLKIDDATQRTRIIDNISTIFSQVNVARAALKTKIRELLAVEGVAEFTSQLKLLGQAVVNYLDIADTAEKCEEFLTRLMVQIEELEGRFAEFDEFVGQLTDKREEVYAAFETRKLQLVEARNRRAAALSGAADRILKGIKSRVDQLQTVNEIHAYFAADLMIDKVRDLVRQLQELDDSVKVDDIQSRLKTIREDAVRQLKDRRELFVGGENVIRLGRHNFSVNVQALDLTCVLHEDQLCLHLTGTRFFEPIRDERLLATREVWDQLLVSENRQVYRGEYLAWLLFEQLRAQPPAEQERVLRLAAEDRLALVQQFMAPRYDESYVKGVSDQDAAKILTALLEMQSELGLLRFDTRARALAVCGWLLFVDPDRRGTWADKLRGAGTVARLFPQATERAHYVAELGELLRDFCLRWELFPDDLVEEAAEYLFLELSGRQDFVVSRTAAELCEAFERHLRVNNYSAHFQQSLAAVQGDARGRFVLLRDWARAFIQQQAAGQSAGQSASQPAGQSAGQRGEFADELALLLLRGKFDPALIVEGHAERELTGLAGVHQVIESGRYRLHYNQFLRKLHAFATQVVPRFQQSVQLKKQLLEQARADMRLEEFRPRVLTSFVRNRLIDSVYLPLIGDNLAKQIGVVGEQKRTDLMGLLLVVSPPGYGKTTLMEYIANRLGIIFMKINGPALGHRLTSLDPAEAPNAAAREEVEKLNLAFEMGDNVMIYLDDIQHCNAELLQKFISLCDAQRKIEGVYKGHTRTYDLRGRKVVVVMAGNPYTESGQRFQIPDMLSNRADVYNLGEIIGDTAEAFELSYLENALTSNPVLNKLASRSQQDVYAVIKMAQRDAREGIELEGNYSLEELDEMVATMKKLLRVRDVILRVNRQYIRSAAQSDDYRTEPPFKLQGSYRNMNRIAERVVPIMNDQELETLILSSYENDAQTLTSDTESNLLKLKEMLGLLSPAEARRWEEICRTFQQNVKLRGVAPDDKVGLVVAQLSSFSDGLHHLRQTLSDGITALAGDRGATEQQQQQQLRELVDNVGAVREGLQSIGQALSAAVAERPADGNSHDPSHGAAALAADAMLKLSEELRALTTGAVPVDTNRPLQRISVMHKVPRSILDVMHSQFELMQSWLQPLLSASQQQQSDIRQLRESLEQCLASYRVLIGDLEGASQRQPGTRTQAGTGTHQQS
ncbi:MAG: DNA repair ATPase [Pirellulaceae bacterium]|nr:DNA repair ATPase [Pirellulaceae bacterium]